MSIRIMSAVWELEGIDSTECLVLLALADHADDDGYCYPSLARLSKRTKLSDRGIRKVVGRLIEAGFLRVEYNAGKAGSNLYQVTPTPEPGSPRNDIPPGTRFTTPRNRVPKTPEPGSSKPSGTIIGGGGSARATDPTWREHMLAAVKVGPDGVIGPSSFIGGVADMATAAKWEAELNLDRSTILAVLAETIASKRDGPPKSFRYFTPAMQRTAATIQAEPLKPADIEGPRHDHQPDRDRRQASADDRHRRIILAAAAARAPSGRDC